MKLSTITKFGIAAILVFSGYILGEHQQNLRIQRQKLENQSNRLNVPAENESRQQRVSRQLERNRVRSDLARVENRIATSRPGISEQSSRTGQLRSNTRIKAEQFTTNSSRGYSRGNAFTHDERSYSRNRDEGRVGTGTYYRTSQHNVRSDAHSSRVYDGARHQSFTSSQFRDPRIFSSVVQPHKHHTIYYSYGRHHNYSRLYPYYHRKYIFVSLNGFWPTYTYRRYYYYGYYPYQWYGYYPTTYEITNNIYTYDSSLGSVDSKVYPNTQSGVTQIPEQTPADTYFDAAVAAFADEQYAIAEQNIALAISAAPDDIVLPYAMVQALFAQGKYTEAAGVLRKAVDNTPTDQEGVIFARGLYSNQDLLFNKIDELADEAGRNYYKDDLHLLLGYQYLGIGRYNDAERHFEKAKFDNTNGKAAAALEEILEELRSAD